MRALAAGAAVCSIALAPGCDRASEPPREVSAQAKAVGATVEALERAIARRDFETVCRRLLTRAVREQAGGRRCPAMLRRTARGVRDPRIWIRSISIQGSRAEAKVVTTAAGQAPAPDTIELVREDGGYRVAALGGSG